ncbi:hypothetical protein C414_000220007 [Campylobacter jejuni subsp. jejuni 414]|nr:hypothetical protein C414_000220007 [Campylobacter jejuni subsp. jejuni 414]
MLGALKLKFTVGIVASAANKLMFKSKNNSIFFKIQKPFFAFLI